MINKIEMSIHFGHFETLPQSQTTFVLPWDANYGAPRLNWWSLPIGAANYPLKWMFGGWISEKSQIRLINHVFDDTKTITALKLKYTLQMIKYDGSELAVDLKDIDIAAKKIPNHNQFILGENFMISELVPHWKNIAFMYVKFKKRTDTQNVHYDNKSTLTLVVVHYL